MTRKESVETAIKNATDSNSLILVKEINRLRREIREQREFYETEMVLLEGEIKSTRIDQ